MIDHDETPQGREPERLLYDWFKHLTSLSLLTLGGVLSLSQAGEIAIDRNQLTIGLLFVAAGGVLAFHGAEVLVAAHVDGKPLPRRVGWMRRASAFALAIGLGMFLGLFLNMLD